MPSIKRIYLKQSITLLGFYDPTRINTYESIDFVAQAGLNILLDHTGVTFCYGRSKVWTPRENIRYAVYEDEKEIEVLNKEELLEEQLYKKKKK